MLQNLSSSEQLQSDEIWPQSRRFGPAQKEIMPASDPNGGFPGSPKSHLLGLLGIFVCKDFLGFSSLRTSWAFRLLGLLGLFVCKDFLGFASLRTSWAFRL